MPPIASSSGIGQLIANDPVARPEDAVKPVDHRDVLTDLSFQFDELRALIPRDEPREELAAFDLLEHVGDRRNVCRRPVRFMPSHASHSPSEGSESEGLGDSCSESG